MKIRIIPFVIFLFLHTAIFPQQEKTTNLPFRQISTGSKAYFTPEKPTYDDMITVRFIPGENSPVKDLDSLYLNTLYLLTERSYKAEEYLMQKVGNEWSVEFAVQNKKAGCIAFQFASTDFGKVDCNDEKGWDILIYDKNGNPVKGAYNAYANGYMTHGLIRRVQDMEKYRTGKLKELELFPEDPINLANTWYFRKMKDNLPIIKREVDSLVQKFPENIKYLELAYYQYSELKDTLNRDTVFNRILELDPKNSVAIWKERGNLFFRAADPNKIDALYQLIQRAVGTDAYETLQRDYFQNLIQAKYYERAAEFVKEWKNPDWIETIVSPRHMLMDCYKVNYSPNKLDLKSKLRLAGDETRLQNITDIATGMTKYAIAGYQNTKVEDRAKDEIPSAWYSERKRFIGIAYGNLGYAKFLTNEFDSAMSYYNKSKKILGDVFYLMGDESYYTMLLKRKKNAYAFEEAKKALELGCENKDLLHQVLMIAADTPALEKEAEELIRKDKSSFVEERGKEVVRNFLKLPKEAIDFTLPDMSGNKINLASLKGKIVILEFWDTYCGWCIKSFEKLQPFYNKHKNDKDVLFLTINTDPESKEKHNTILRYLKEHNFNFPVLFDSDNSVVSSYKLNGVPQTLVIGKDGKVHYRESGYGGPTIADDLEKVVSKISKIK